MYSNELLFRELSTKIALMIYSRESILKSDINQLSIVIDNLIALYQDKENMPKFFAFDLLTFSDLFLGAYPFCIEDSNQDIVNNLESKIVSLVDNILISRT